MAKVPGIVNQLRMERDKVERQLSGLNAALSAFIGAYTGKDKDTAKPARKRRKMSAKARAKIVAAQKKRWRAWKAKRKKIA